jgi:hypothetical protein
MTEEAANFLAGGGVNKADVIVRAAEGEGFAVGGISDRRGVISEADRAEARDGARGQRVFVAVEFWGFLLRVIGGAAGVYAGERETCRE